MTEAELAEVAISHAAEPLASRLREEPDLGGRLQRMVAAARAAWPGVDVPDEEVVAFVAERAAADGAPAAVLEPSCGDDLYLACACARGDTRAVAVFEQTYLREVPAMIARVDPTPALVDEVQQVLRAALFVVAPGKRPRIADYAGRGKLRGWLRIGALREAIRILERSPTIADPDRAPEPVADKDPELQYMRRLYGEAFRRAFRAAFEELTPSERQLLRGSFLEGLAIDRLAATLGIHRATVARRLARARANLLLHTRKSLAAQVGVSRAEVDSILEILDTGLEASVRELFSPA